MVSEQGTVVRVGQGFVIVEVLQTSACKSCSARQGCGQAVLSELGSADRQGKKNHFHIQYDQLVEVGDVVELVMAEDVVSKVALLVYVLPLFISFLVLYGVAQTTQSEPFQLLAFVSSLLISFFGISRLKLNKGSILEPEILAVYPRSKAADIIASSPQHRV